jgi:hypothetical protein
MSLVNRGLVCAGLFGALIVGAMPVLAQDAPPKKDPYVLDDNKMLDTMFFRSVMGGLGLRDDDNAITYRERSPLVIPPVTTLPPPATGAIKSANWPIDPEVRLRRDLKATEAKSATANGDSVMNEARVLMPDELERGRNNAMKKGRGPGLSGEESWRASRPNELGVSSLWGVFKGPKSEDSKAFAGEPARTSLIEPPAGYQTPATSQPYGVGKDPRAGYGPVKSYYDNYGTYEGR